MMALPTILRRMLVAVLMGTVLTGTAVISHSAQARGVEIVSVQSQGLGITQRDAVLDGVREAVSMVNGMAIASQTSLAELTTEVTTDTGSAFLMSSAFMEQVSTATSGIVEEYDILSSSEDANTGLVIVELSVRVARYTASKQLDRLRMALGAMRIDNSPGSGGGSGICRGFAGRGD